MHQTAERRVDKEVDSIQQRLTDYACSLNYDSLSFAAIYMAKACTIDTLGALIGGFYGEPCHIVRNLAARMPPDPNGATVIGTRMKTTPDMAAFVNGTTARYMEANDVYHYPGSRITHPSDVLTPVLAAAEHGRVNGREFLTGVVLAYEVCLRICDVAPDQGLDEITFNCLATAVAAGKLLCLTPAQLSHCISMAIVPNNVLRWKTGHLSMYKAATAGQAGREGVFAALLAREGMDSPPLPFEGKHGWCNQMAKRHFSLDVMGGKGTPFKVQDTMIKPRAYGAHMIGPILAAEKVAAAIKNGIDDVKRVTVEVYRAKESAGSSTAVGGHHWNPDSRETADHSIPYTVAVALMDGTVTPRSFDDAHLWSPELRALIQKIEVVENAEFTKAYEQLPVEHRTRVTVMAGNGERVIGESGGDEDDLSAQKSAKQIEEKFRALTEDYLGAKRVNSVLEQLWNLEEVGSIAEIPPAFVIG